MVVVPENFKEFLDDPSACSLAEFYDMAKAWGAYLLEHPELNYLTSDDWKEIRERLLDEFEIREDARFDILDEWDDMIEAARSNPPTTSQDCIEVLRKRLNFMKLHQKILEVSDEQMEKMEKNLKSMEKKYQEELIILKKLRRSEFEYENAVAALDDELVKVSRQCGRTVHTFRFKSVKKHNGN
ncbi:MAG: hypothetical protein LUM44_14015 [Pyrinomonadaceae bacterium]|nr:hypothetical protein [Pyrinomonadaceae bacterium]